MSMVRIDGEWIPETNVSTPLEPNLQHFTPEQIEKHVALCQKYYEKDGGELYLDSVRIIRQLQSELPQPSVEVCT